MGNLTPTYNLYLEVNDSKKFLIMKGQRKAFKG